MGWGSLGTRLLAGAAVWVVLALAVSAFVLVGLFRDHAEAELARRMAHQVDELVATLTVTPDGALAAGRELSDPLFRQPLSGFYWQATLGSRPPLRSRSLWDQALAVAAPEGNGDAERPRRLQGPDGKPLLAWVRTFTLPDAAEPVVVTVAAETLLVEEATQSFTRALALCLGVLAAGLIGAAVVQVRVGLRPLRRLGGALRDLREGRTARVVGRFPDEVQPLVEDLNTVLNEHARMVERAGTQAGNLAHALKTPLAVIANDAMESSDQTAGQRIAEEAARMRRHIDFHLTRARAAASVNIPGSRAAVEPVVEGLARAIRQLNAGRGLIVDVAPGGEAAFRGAAHDLQEMLGNLLENAAAWAAGRVAVGWRVGSITAGNRLVLTVDDDGPGIPEAARALALARGGRLDESVPGSGLGLAIVVELAELYGGTLTLEEGPLGGLRAVLDLPAAVTRSSSAAAS